MWGLPSAECRDRARPVPSAISAGLRSEFARVHGLLKARSSARLQPHPSGAGADPKDSSDHTLRTLGVGTHAVRAPQREPDISTVYGRGAARLPRVLRLHRRHFGGQRLAGGASHASATRAGATELVWCHTEPRQVRVRCSQDPVPGPRRRPRGHCASPAQSDGGSGLPAHHDRETAPALHRHYHRFVPGAAALLRPLSSLITKKSSKKSVRPVQWTDSALAAFDAVKAKLAAATRLAHPVPGAELSVQVDASDSGAGGVLQQYVDGSWTPLSYFSKTLKPAETRYSTFGRELLAVYLAVKHFRHSLEGRHFTIFTDHKALVSAVSSGSSTYSPREIRHLDFICQLTTDVRHVPGKDNVVADTLSRTVSMLQSPTPPLDDFDALAAAQQEDEGLRAFLTTQHGLQVRAVPLASGRTLLCDESTGSIRPLIPDALRRSYFQILHGLSHPGIRATQELIARRVVWPGMNKDVRNWTRGCIACQRSKVHRHTRAPVSTWTPPAGRFEEIHIDLVGPLPPSEGQSFLLTCVDRFTRWVEAIPLPRYFSGSPRQCRVWGGGYVAGPVGRHSSGCSRR